MRAADRLRLDAERDEAIRAPYDPWRGTGGPLERFPLPLQPDGADLLDDALTWRTVWLPVAMQDAAQPILDAGSLASFAEAHGVEYVDALAELMRARFVHDYEFWAATCATVEDKDTGRLVPLVLNPSQRASVAVREADRLGTGRVRQIELKGRQYGSSTEKTAYLSWLQTVVAPDRGDRASAYVIALDADGASDIAARFDRLAANLPPQARSMLGEITFKGLLGSTNTRRVLVGEEEVGRLMLGSAAAPNAPSGRTAQIALVSELGKMTSTAAKGANILLTNLTSIVPPAAGSCLMLESTAAEAGAWFKRAVYRARAAKGSYRLVFISWLIDPQYTLPLDDAARAEVAATLGTYHESGEDNDHEKKIWTLGGTLGHIAFFRHRRGELDFLHEFQQEYPSDVDEAWATAGKRVIAASYIAAARKTAREPLMRGDLVADGWEGREAFVGVRFEPDSRGPLLVWSPPLDKLGGLLARRVLSRYIVAADVGGASETSDPHCSVVLDRGPRLVGGLPVVAAEWHGHCDVDRYAWASARLAAWYDNALWVPEINTIVNKAARERGPSYGETVVDLIKSAYPRVYQRTVLDQSTGKPVNKAGFHMNSKTKGASITALIRALRAVHAGEGSDEWEAGYIERHEAALHEYEVLLEVDGAIQAAEGEHDDRADVRAIALYVDGEAGTPSVMWEPEAAPKKRRVVSEASFG